MPSQWAATYTTNTRHEKIIPFSRIRTRDTSNQALGRTATGVGILLSTISNTLFHSICYPHMIKHTLVQNVGHYSTLRRCVITYRTLILRVNTDFEHRMALRLTAALRKQLECNYHSSTIAADNITVCTSFIILQNLLHFPQNIHYSTTTVILF
jgi:hypothetical protein